MRDLLTFAQESCRSGPRLEFGDARGIECERISQKFGHADLGAMMGHRLPLCPGFELLYSTLLTGPLTLQNSP